MKSAAKIFLIANCALVSLGGCNKWRDQSETNGTKPEEHLALGPLDPSDPAQLVVIQWHQALVANDFAKYSAVAIRGADESDELRKLVFDTMRSGAPDTILANDGTKDLEKLSTPEDKSWIGLRSFALVGCIKRAADGQIVRVMSVVSVRHVLGEWKVYGGSFGAPSTPFAGQCPISVGT
jgi:hypothetical protein